MTQTIEQLRAQEDALTQAIARKRRENAEAVVVGNEPDIEAVTKTEQALRSVEEAIQLAEGLADEKTRVAAAERLYASVQGIEQLEETRLSCVEEMEMHARRLAELIVEHDGLAAQQIGIANAEETLRPTVSGNLPDIHEQRTSTRLAGHLVDTLRAVSGRDRLAFLDLTARSELSAQEAKRGKTWMECEREAVAGFFESLHRAVVLRRAA